MHVLHDLEPYKSVEDAISTWPETVTAVGVRLEDDNLQFVAPYGIDDLANLIIRPSPKFEGSVEDARRRVRERVEQKNWLKKWPKLRLSSDLIPTFSRTLE